jgi:hypothetical protein
MGSIHASSADSAHTNGARRLGGLAGSANAINDGFLLDSFDRY